MFVLLGNCGIGTQALGLENVLSIGERAKAAAQGCGEHMDYDDNRTQ